MLRRAARARALQALFAIDLGHTSPELALEQVIGESELPPRAAAFTRQLVEGTLARQEELDTIISRYATGWRLERLAAVDRNILRLALYELQYHRETPVGVVINEAIELAKGFNNEEAGKFVNGLLDNARKDLGLGEDLEDGHSGD
ncbi:transcription antitermination factor NusB [Moorella sp. Hama-1]|uniref:transcription antitermination factor NusB n=1 Tax=Moorella sp. Hama-1 TaxID=2138101 RepID=UPI000D649E67|nr:transcription antitermination factor NusB [Moorella sp. Hama-1]BCV21781.1 N utilization substance protein B [Moorella sp. Hama-1]